MKNNVDALFFTPDVFAAGRPKHPVIPSEKMPSRISPRVPLLRAAWSERVGSEEEEEGRRKNDIQEETF